MTKRITYYYLLTTLLCCCYTLPTFAQTAYAPKITLSGTVVNGSNNEPITNVHILRKDGSGTTTDENGGFSLEVKVGSDLVITHLSYVNARVSVPTDLADKTYEMVIPLYNNDVTLDVVEVYPYPSREDFKIEFLSPQTAEEVTRPVQMSGIRQQVGPVKVPPPTLMNPISLLASTFSKTAIRNRKMRKYRKIIDEKYQREE
ncbi:MAG: carboxypeptidase-like regulatory domain-containing protein [Chitinophagales bacterium]